MLDSEEYSQFIVKTHSKLLAFARGRLHQCSRQDAPDVVQSALMAVWRHREEDITNLRQYVFIAILQACMDRNKRMGLYRARFKSDDVAMRRRTCLPEGHTQAQISEVLRMVPIRDRIAWLECIESGSGRFPVPEGETTYFRNRIARQRAKIRKVYTAAA